MDQCNVRSFSNFFKQLKNDTQIFILPCHLKESKQKLHVWDPKAQVDSIFIDSMSEVNRQNVRLSRHINTFKKTTCDVWNDRPQLVNFKRCIESEWQPSIHDLRKEKLIIHITQVEKDPCAKSQHKSQVKLNIFSYEHVQDIAKKRTFKHDAKKYTNAMIVSMSEINDEFSGLLGLSQQYETDTLL